MAVESFSVKAVLSAEDHMTKSIRGALGQLDGLGSKIRSGIGFGFLMSIGQTAFNTIAGAARGLFSDMNASQKTWKTFEGNMQMLNASSEDINYNIDALKGNFQKFAQETIYSSSDMASTFSQLAAVGIDSADELVTGFAGIAASAEEPKQAMKTLSQQATQMAAKPTVAWQDFKLMLEQAPAGMAAVAKDMGMNLQELVAAVQDGTVKTDEFFEAIKRVGNSEDFKDMATHYQTLDQAMDGLQETIANTLAPAFEMLSGKGISAVEGIISKVEAIDGQALADKIGGWIEQAQPYFDQFKIVAGYVWDALQLVGSALSTVGQFFLDNADKIAPIIPVLAAVAGGFFALGIVSSIVGPISSVVGAIGNLGSLPLPKIAANLLGTAAAEEAEGAASATAVGPTLAMAAAFIAMGAGVLLASAGLYLIAQAAIQLASAGPAAAVGMVGMVAAIAGLAAGAALLGPALTAGSVGMIAFGGAIVMIGAGIMLACAGMTMLAGSLPAIATYGMAAAMGMMMLSSAMLMLTAGAAAASVGLVALTASSVASAAGIAAFGVAATASAAGVVALAGAAKLVASQLKSIDKSSKSASANLTAMVGSVSIVSEGLGALGEKANSAMTTLTNAFTNAASKAQQAGRKVGEGFTNGMKSGLSKAPSAAKSAVNSTISAMNGGYSSAYSAGQRIGKGFVDGLRSQLASVRSIAGEIKAASTMSSASYSMAGATLGGYSYSSGPAIIEIPVEIDGRQVAKATATYTADELDKISVRNSRKAGKA